MQNKKYVVIFIAFLCLALLAVGFFNSNKIVQYIQGREWEFAESYATLNFEKLLQVEAGKLLLVSTGSDLFFYGTDAEEGYKESLISTELITDYSENYMVVVVRDTNTIFLFKNSSLVWKKELNENIQNISVNKNGYVTVIYSQSGYKAKSSIKIYKPSGDELFTTYLGSTYAIDVEMTNNNKILYIAELDTEGIKAKSAIKAIHIAEVETSKNPKVEIIPVETDELIIDIECNAENQLYILKNSGIDVLKEEKGIENVYAFEIKNTLFASIKGVRYPVVIESMATGIFTNETKLKVLKENSVEEIKISGNLQSMDTYGDIIAINLEKEVLFLNLNAKVVKRYELEKPLLAVKVFGDGGNAALVFRNKIELVKL